MQTTTETQVCSQCNTEKPLSEFHRRADRYQKKCKTCRCMNEKQDYKKNGRSRTTSPAIIKKENIPALAEMIESIEPHLRAKAKRYSDFPLEADDVYSAMVEAILTKSDPSDSPARMLQHADWAASNYMQAKRTYTYHIDAPEDDGDQFTTITTPEDIIVENEVSNELKSIIDQLPEEYRKVVSMLYVGLNRKEIANQLHVTEMAVSEKIKRIGNKMTSLGLSFA